MTDSATTVKVHALLSPSSSHQWSRCPAAPMRQKDLPDTSGEPAWWGTVAHDLAERVLRVNKIDGLYDMEDLWGYQPQGGEVGKPEYVKKKPANAVFAVQISREMIECVETYVTYVQNLVAETGGQLLVEQRLSIEHITGEKDAAGTGDAVILAGDTLYVLDLKTGMVEVVASEPWNPAPKDLGYDVLSDAKRMPNTQLLMYASGAYEQHKMFEDFKQVCMIIVQPRLNNIDEHTLSINEFTRWVTWLNLRAKEVWAENPLAIPGEKQCRYCKVQDTCAELRADILDTAFGDTDDLAAAEPRIVPDSELATIYRKLPLIKQFCDSIKARVFSDLEAGRPVADAAGGFKIVEGRAGNRKWSDEAAVEALLKKLKIKSTDIYTKSVITPPAAAKLLEKSEPEKWSQVQAFITRGNSSQSVVPDSDPRPAVSSVHDDFEDISKSGADVSEFF